MHYARIGGVFRSCQTSELELLLGKKWTAYPFAILAIKSILDVLQRSEYTFVFLMK